MKNVQVRLAEPKDAKNCAEWMINTPHNCLDRDIVEYPSLRTLAIDVKGETVTFVPFHPVMVVESLAHKPGITPRQNAAALITFQEAIEQLAKQYGMSEIMWMCKDDSLIEFAEKQGYEVVQTKVLRKKVGK